MFQNFEETGGPTIGRKNLPLLRQALTSCNVDGMIVPHEDEWQNEYVPPAFDRLAWLTGFTGSAGAAIVLKDRAAVFVDGRYTLQARTQVDAKLFELRDLADNGPAAFLREAAHNHVIGYDPRLISPDALARFQQAAQAVDARLLPLAPNPIDKAWRGRPPLPNAAIKPHPIEFSGEGSAEKRARLGAELRARKEDAALITAPASLAWLFNIRGGDVARTPLPLGEALLFADGRAELFVEPTKTDAGLRAWLGDEVRVLPPDALSASLAALADKRVRLDPSGATAYHAAALAEAKAEISHGPDPVALPRARKNAQERAGARRAHERDGAALARFLHWMAHEGQSGKVDEITACQKLEEYRTQSNLLRDLSFDTISGAGPNGAIVHYRVTAKTNRKLARGSLFLVDSGAQYEDGTTDVTRTIAIGRPTREMRERFTQVLKGHIALARVRFPKGTAGHQLDALARLSLWQAGLDYDHGTGHGVGSYLGVHEGPHRISKAAGGAALEPGMIVSNEPGYYKTGAYGIRIENLQMVTEPEVPAGGERPMMGFETLTLAPIDRALIIRAALTTEERAWLDAYHARVFAVIGPSLDSATRAWLETATAPI